MALYKPNASVSHPQEDFLMEGEMSQSSPSATAANSTGTTFAAANLRSEHQSSISYGLPSLNQFMPDHQRPLLVGPLQPLLLNAPAPMEVDANASPSEATIRITMEAMDSGTTEDGVQSGLLAIQPPEGDPSLQAFRRMSKTAPENVRKDLRTVEHIKDYLQHFGHPAICHNRVHLGRLQRVVQD